MNMGGMEYIVVLVLLILIPSFAYFLGYKMGKKSGYINRVKEKESK
jgi:hypothetical protein